MPEYVTPHWRELPAIACRRAYGHWSARVSPWMWLGGWEAKSPAHSWARALAGQRHISKYLAMESRIIYDWKLL